MQTVAERIKRYRLLAEEVRTAGESMETADARAVLIRMADNYEKLADQLETLGSPSGETPTGTE
jgi:hypothetical protein